MRQKRRTSVSSLLSFLEYKFEKKALLSQKASLMKVPLVDGDRVAVKKKRTHKRDKKKRLEIN